MVLVPEARTSRQEVRQAIAAQFWGQPVAGVRSLDGLSKLLPCEPPALPQTAPSGLSRSQQLLAFQAVALPAMPAFNSAQGGVVLDRALARFGGRNWWTVLLGRARAQRIWSLHRQGLRTAEALKHAENYGLCSRTRVGIGRSTTLNALVEVADLKALHERLTSPEGCTLRTCTPLNAAVTLKHDVLDHEIVANAALNQEHIDSSAVYDTIPITSSLDVRSKDRSDGLQYRAGLHYVYAPENELRPGALRPVDAREAAAFDGAAAAAGPWRSALHAQGAVAVEGEALLWRPAPPRSRAYAGLPPPDPPEDGGSEPEAVQASTDGSVRGSSSDGPVEGTAVLVARGSGDGNGDPLATGKSADAAGSSRKQAATGPAVRSSSGSYQRPDENDWEGFEDGPLPMVVTSHGPITRRRLESQWQHTPLRRRLPARESWRRFRAAASSALNGSGSDAGSEAEEAIEDPLMAPVQLPSPAAIQSGVKKAKRRADTVHSVASRAVAEVRAGGLADKLELAAKWRARRSARRPYSPWLAQPYAKAHGAVGCLARMPLPTLGGVPRPHVESGNGHAATDDGIAADGSLATRIRNAWNPYLRETTLRIFASAGLSAQLGRFTRPVLDFSSVSARLDLGITSQHTGGGGLRDSGVSDGGELCTHRAFALEGRNIWHAANLSLAQQLLGPVRARADFRLSLHVPGGYSPVDGDRASLRSLWEAAVGVRPAPLERVFGLDMVLPNTAGAGRACIWWSPARREAMAELRLC